MIVFGYVRHRGESTGIRIVHLNRVNTQCGHEKDPPVGKQYSVVAVTTDSHVFRWRRGPGFRIEYLRADEQSRRPENAGTGGRRGVVSRQLSQAAGDEDLAIRQ